MLAREGSAAGGGSSHGHCNVRPHTPVRHYLNVTNPNFAQPGGLWINLGPLLYHWAEPNELPNEPNVELPLEDVLDVARRLGFDLEERETVEAPFTSDCRWGAVCCDLALPWICDSSSGQRRDNHTSISCGHRGMYQTIYQCAFWTMRRQA